MSVVKEIVVAATGGAASELIKQIGEGVREKLREQRERDKPCAHGKPGGRLCAQCAEQKP